MELNLNHIPTHGAQVDDIPGELRGEQLRDVGSNFSHVPAAGDAQILHAGNLGGEAGALTLENGGLLIELNGCFDLDSDVRSDAEGIIDDIIAGNIDPN